MSQILLIMWLKYWNFSFNISPSSEYSGRISSKMDWLDLFAVLVLVLKDLVGLHKTIQLQFLQRYWLGME